VKASGLEQVCSVNVIAIAFFIPHKTWRISMRARKPFSEIFGTTGSNDLSDSDWVFRPLRNRFSSPICN